MQVLRSTAAVKAVVLQLFERKLDFRIGPPQPKIERTLVTAHLRAPTRQPFLPLAPFASVVALVAGTLDQDPYYPTEEQP